MPANKRITIAGMGGIRPYLDTLARMNNNEMDYNWFDKQCAKVEAKKKNKREVYELMGIAQNTFEKYLLLRNIERVQRDNGGKADE